MRPRPASSCRRYETCKLLWTSRSGLCDGFTIVAFKASSAPRPARMASPAYAPPEGIVGPALLRSRGVDAGR